MKTALRLRAAQSERGVALLFAMMAMSALSVMAFALALSASVDRLAETNHHEAMELANAAESALELAARDLAVIPDWDPVLAGELQGQRVDGLPDGIRQPLPGLTVDLTALTNQLTCGQSSSCLDGSVRASTAERPWGENNPRWRPFLYDLFQFPGPRRASSAYAVVWVGDDGGEADANPLTDGGGPAGEGRYIIRARAEAFGRGGGRHAVEAELVRSCQTVDGETQCTPGLRVQSWRTVAASAAP